MSLMHKTQGILKSGESWFWFAHLALPLSPFLKITTCHWQLDCFTVVARYL